MLSMNILWESTEACNFFWFETETLYEVPFLRHQTEMRYQKRNFDGPSCGRESHRNTLWRRSVWSEQWEPQVFGQQNIGTQLPNTLYIYIYICSVYIYLILLYHTVVYLHSPKCLGKILQRIYIIISIGVTSLQVSRCNLGSRGAIHMTPFSVNVAASTAIPDCVFTFPAP